MIFEQETLQFQLLDVLYFDDMSVEMRTKPRPFCAVSLRLEGETFIDLRDKKIRLAERDLAFFPANVGYLRHSEADKRIVFHFNLLNFAPYEIEVLHNVPFDTICPLFEEALSLWESRTSGYYYRASALLYEVFAHIRQTTPLAVTQYSTPVATALATFAANYADHTLTVASVAASLHMSETYFRNKFREEIGVNPKKYLNDLRMEHAQTLLNAGYDSVAAVAAKVGFRDTKNFATAFRHTFGYPPSAQHYKFTE